MFNSNKFFNKSFKQVVSFSLDVFRRMLGSNMVAESTITDASRFLSKSLFTMVQNKSLHTFYKHLDLIDSYKAFLLQIINFIFNCKPYTYFFQHSIDFPCYINLFFFAFHFCQSVFSRTAGLINSSINLDTNSFRSLYIKESMGLLEWYFFKKGSTMSATKLKNLSLAKIKGSFNASWTVL